MNLEYSPRVLSLHKRVKAFLDEHVFPQYSRREQEIAENARKGRPYAPYPVLEELKTKAKAEGLWNLFLPESEFGAGLTNLEYAPIAEMMGKQYWASEVFNCSAPDTGNMEVLVRYGTEEQKRQWLTPLLNGEIRSAFAMTEPAVASSDATNIECSIRRDGDDYVINGRKWYITGAAAENCKVFVLMGKTDPHNPDRHRQQSMILVPKDTPGVTIVRDMALYGFMDPPAGHPEVLFENVRVPATNILLGEGRGFEIAQGRLGPGRIHHCMRVVGMAEAALELMCRRVVSRVAFHKPLSDQSVWRERIAKSRMLIEQTRLLVLNAAYKMDTVGNKVAAKEIAMIKVVAPNNCCKVIDWAIQAHGAGGFSQDYLLTSYYAYARHLRTADGPDEVHSNAIAKQELAPYLAAARK
ncbi:acyl-CoA dehydrogenase family protein [Noviherbaspirillum sp.]|uniref:acyl-CoA dehydrogenase family protein n=1 Tax=Noviherbaspirillum sp. TaxID=1926288 RepID=UPI002B45FF8B|nr:acyl-CoA dehydrogenase family protein [Noviherbaspirillum sp.]HJV80169.1 acyl-CoA dehydrogenase family protein [Noviherbaspirillum sp.]